MTDARPYLLALGVGLLVGIIYALVGVRSPAPPVIALVGLLGILVGEQIPPFAKRLMTGKPVTIAWVKFECLPHILGPLPGRDAVRRSRSSEPS